MAYLHITSSSNVSCNGLSRSSRMTTLSASHLSDTPFSKRVAVKIIWLTVSNVPSLCMYYTQHSAFKQTKKEKRETQKRILLCNPLNFHHNKKLYLKNEIFLTFLVLIVVSSLESSIIFELLYQVTLAAGRPPST